MSNKQQAAVWPKVEHIPWRHMVFRCGCEIWQICFNGSSKICSSCIGSSYQYTTNWWHIWVTQPQWIDLYQHNFCSWFSHTKDIMVASIPGNIHVFWACFQFVKTIRQHCHIYTLVIFLIYAPGSSACVQKLGFIIHYGLLIEDIWPWNLLYIYKRDIWTKVRNCFWISNILSTPKL